MSFVPLDAGAPERGTADPCVVPEDVEAGLLGEEGRCAACDRAQIGEVEMETLKLSRVRCFASGRLYGLDRRGDTGLIAACDVDGSAFRVEHLDQFISYTCVSAGHDEDFSYERGDVGFGEGRTWREQLGPNSSHD